MSECAGLSGEQTEFLLIMRKIEAMWRQGFVGTMTLNCGPAPHRNLRFEYTESWKPGKESHEGRTKE